MGPQPTAGEEVEVGAGRLQAQLPKVDYQEPASSPCCAQGLEGHQPCDCTELWIGPEKYIKTSICQTSL